MLELANRLLESGYGNMDTTVTYNHWAMKNNVWLFSSSLQSCNVMAGPTEMLRHPMQLLLFLLYDSILFLSHSIQLCLNL